MWQIRKTPHLDVPNGRNHYQQRGDLKIKSYGHTCGPPKFTYCIGLLLFSYGFVGLNDIFNILVGCYDLDFRMNWMIEIYFRVWFSL